jgi:hypothetical protein
LKPLSKIEWKKLRPSELKNNRKWWNYERSNQEEKEGIDCKISFLD